ncbi:domain of unknown function DUF1738 [Rhodomicrobium vannielii ATCC 17100]|uniref:Uncharacterized protein n=1 Tax=Rhodomicrobium vannielii (strain ATCC 17100 / DSM 162 / LMG 4299 / NCIMB 10020 / ATH 3.1.1) TaxID=648757 RepID=E3I6Q1_RHOVT|nr:zincin-like metallopeptidase domain-containing protein [Rhodomicrobium vannielii]ADP70698.1 domain of unknown function DUF1738 [Rhodomicrobium vannielii ATCC 17100]
MTRAAPSLDVYQAVTDRIVAALESAGEASLPWHRPGLDSLLPKNASTGNGYRGINVVSLWAEAQLAGYTRNLWASYRQWQELGAQVKKGAKSSIVIFYKEFEVEPETANPDDDGKRRVAKASRVFNASQVEGFELPPMPENLGPIARNARADEVVAATGADIRHGGEAAYYRPSADYIQMPEEGLFMDNAHRCRSEAYYSVLFHELGHWSGAERRLNRKLGNKFGSPDYALEELIAELTSAFLCAELRFSPQPRPDHAQYIANWLKALKSDKRAVFTASARAAEAADFLVKPSS